jgi:gamma-glutamylcyclotransferase
LKYFAYGSNMLRERLQERVLSAQVLTTASLRGRCLVFHKHSTDGSGKCDMALTDCPEDEVHGVVFEIDPAEKTALDRCEGLGYGYHGAQVEVIQSDGTTTTACTYLASPSHVAPPLCPYTWYKDLVLAGARQNRLPAEYIARIQAVQAREDLDQERNRKHRRILERASAGPDNH